MNMTGLTHDASGANRAPLPSRRTVLHKASTILEMHGVKVVPASTPNKSVFLEDMHDLDGDAIVVFESAFTVSAHRQ